MADGRTQADPLPGAAASERDQ